MPLLPMLGDPNANRSLIQWVGWAGQWPEGRTPTPKPSRKKERERDRDRETERQNRETERQRDRDRDRDRDRQTPGPGFSCMSKAYRQDVRAGGAPYARTALRQIGIPVLPRLRIQWHRMTTARPERRETDRAVQFLPGHLFIIPNVTWQESWILSGHRNPWQQGQ